ALAGAARLAGDFGVTAEVWSVTSWSKLARDGMAWEREQRLSGPAAEAGSGQAADHPFVRRQLSPTAGPIVAVSDYVRAVPESIRAYLPEGRRYVTLGTDGFGRSDTRAELRAFFEVDRAAIVLAAIHSLHQAGQVPDEALRDARTGPSIDCDSQPPWLR
ncbi:MAG: pyruvate dehydrogenase (acetyl-transferring), homodimeric type, partial [Lautropia sp.]